MNNANQHIAARPALDRTPRLSRLRDHALLLGLVGLLVAGLMGLIFATGWRETTAQVMQLGPLQIAALLALSLGNYVLRALRWHLFTRRLGLRTTLLQDTRHYFGGFAMTVTPGRVGELIRMRWIRRETGWSFDRTAPLTLVDRASDLLAIALILMIGTLMTVGGHSTALALPLALLALVAALIVTRPALLYGFANLAYRLTGRLARLMARLRRAARSMARFTDPRLIAATTALGLVGWMAEAWSFHLLLDWMGADIHLWSAVLIFVFATLAGGLTGAPGGLGGAEAAMMGLLVLQSIPAETALAATLVIRLTTLWFAIAIGLAVLPFAERSAAKALI